MGMMRQGWWLCVAVAAVCAAQGCGRGGETVGGGAVDPNWARTGGRLIFSDNFASGLDTNKWNNTADAEGWVVNDGVLHSAGTRNKALWLRQALPQRVRIEFDARSESPHGDIKVEVFGDGEHHESGYILIFGGWKNSINTIARMDEHGKDRFVGARDVKVEQSKVYKMAVVRTDNTVRWYLDRDKGTVLLEYKDERPLVGPQHSHFAFNNWSVPLYFDNVSVYDLGAGGP